MTELSKPIAIIGGGIAGLSLLRALTAAGVDARLFERRSFSSSDGFAVNLPGNAIQALGALGLRDEIEHIGRPIRRREYRTAADRLLFEVDEDAFWGPEARPRGVRRSDLIQLLSRDLPQRDLRHDATVDAVQMHDDRAELVLADGSLIATDLVVGADGVHSVVRRDGLKNVQGLGSAVLANASWRFVVANPGIECWTVWAGRRGMVLLMPVDEHQVYGWVAIPGGDALGQSLTIGDILDEFPARVRCALGRALENPQGLFHSPLEEVRLDRWTGRRIALIGDAAHATAPVWAEGVALGLEDAVVLTRCLTAETDLGLALADYQRRRRPRVEHVQSMTDAMSKAARLPIVLRNLLMPYIGPKRYKQTYGPLKSRF